MSAKSLQKHKEENNFREFYKRLSDFIPELKQFLIGSLKAAECQALLDRGFYDPEELLDEIFLETFEAYSDEVEESKLRRSLFKKAIGKMLEKRSLEVPDDVNTHSLLKEELRALDEELTTDAEGDLILKEELDDISYSQKRGWTTPILLDKALEQQLIGQLDLHEDVLISEEKRRLLGQLYYSVPPKSKTVIELMVFGNQDTTEISEIMEVPEAIIQKVLFKVKERFRLL